jgi:hypothetical protein
MLEKAGITLTGDISMTKTPVVVSADADADEMNLLHGEYLTMLDDCETCLNWRSE